MLPSLFEKSLLPLGFLDAAAGDVKILLLQFNANEFAALLDGCNAGGAGTHKGVGNYLPAHCVVIQEVPHKFYWFLVWVYPITRRHFSDNIGLRFAFFVPEQFASCLMRNHHHFVLSAISPTKAGVIFVPYHRMEERQTTRVHPVCNPSKSGPWTTTTTTTTTTTIWVQDANSLGQHSVNDSSHTTCIIVGDRLAFYTPVCV